MRINYEKENEKLQSQIEALQKEIAENDKKIEQENALKKEIREAFNIQNPNADIYKHDDIMLGWDHYNTNYFSVLQEMDVSNISKRYNKATVLTHFIYRFDNGTKVDILPLLFKDELIDSVKVVINYDDTDTLFFYNLDDNVFTEVSVNYLKKGKGLSFRKKRMAERRSSGVNTIINGYEEHSWVETLKKFGENETVVDLEKGIKSKQVQVQVIENILDNQFVR